MQKITLYRYARSNGGTTVSPKKPDCEYTETYRLIADEGKILQNGDTQAVCVDTNDTTNWVEVDCVEPEEPAE